MNVCRSKALVPSLAAAGAALAVMLLVRHDLAAVGAAIAVAALTRVWL